MNKSAINSIIEQIEEFKRFLTKLRETLNSIHNTDNTLLNVFKDEIYPVPNQNQELWSDKIIEYSWDDAFNFAKQLNKEKHLGRNNWRLPKLWELLKAYDFKIDGFGKESWFWSSSSNVDYSNEAWGVYFDDGGASYGHKSNGRHVRCVSSGTE